MTNTLIRKCFLPTVANGVPRTFRTTLPVFYSPYELGLTEAERYLGDDPGTGPWCVAGILTITSRTQAASLQITLPDPPPYQAVKQDLS